MKFLSKIAVFFAIIYLVLVVHSLRYEATDKGEAIALLSVHVKDVEPSLSYRSNEYKRFVYAK